jgi:hypothetical protein
MDDKRRAGLIKSDARGLAAVFARVGLEKFEARIPNNLLLKTYKFTSFVTSAFARASLLLVEVSAERVRQ